VLPIAGLVSSSSSRSIQNGSSSAAAAAAAAVPACLAVDEVALYLVFPDGWQFDLHR
jgi:hypothetical protein